VWAHWNKYTGFTSASCVQRSNDSWFCNSHCISHSSCVLHRYGSQDIHRWKFKDFINLLNSVIDLSCYMIINLGCLHDPVAQLSRLQRIYPYALWNCNSSARPRDFYPEPVANLLRFRAKGLSGCLGIHRKPFLFWTSPLTLRLCHPKVLLNGRILSTSMNAKS